MAQTRIKFTNERIGDFLKRIRNVPEFKRRVNYYKAFGYLCKTNPEKFRMRWVGIDLYCEQYQRVYGWDASWMDWEKVNPEMFEKITLLDFILDEKYAVGGSK